MKTILKVIWGIFAVIGILSLVLFINLRQKYGNFRLTVHPGYEARYDEFVDLLRTSGPFEKDTVAFDMTLAIGKFVANNIPHDNPG